MRKGQVFFSALIVILTAFNFLLWLGLAQSGPAPRSGRILILIIMLALFALFADKTSNNPYAPGFIRVICLLGLIAMIFVLNIQ